MQYNNDTSACWNNYIFRHIPLFIGVHTHQVYYGFIFTVERLEEVDELLKQTNIQIHQIKLNYFMIL